MNNYEKMVNQFFDNMIKGLNDDNLDFDVNVNPEETDYMEVEMEVNGSIIRFANFDDFMCFVKEMAKIKL